MSPRCAARTVLPVAGTCTHYVQCVPLGCRPPCASGTYSTREAGTRRLYAPYGGPGACVSAESGASVCPALSHALGAPSGGARALMSDMWMPDDDARISSNSAVRHTADGSRPLGRPARPPAAAAAGAHASSAELIEYIGTPLCSQRHPRFPKTGVPRRNRFSSKSAQNKGRCERARCGRIRQRRRGYRRGGAAPAPSPSPHRSWGSSAPACATWSRLISVEPLASSSVARREHEGGCTFGGTRSERGFHFRTIRAPR